ncbi:glucosaminidase domain-containing protein [Roseateles sp. UC29_93]|uniref:glucosaminidase domain-containing protein n=1 Tax=Roseateles sp. UC29_93 TaxID=3350177 RepID=UPI00366EFD63
MRNVELRAGEFPSLASAQVAPARAASAGAIGGVGAVSPIGATSTAGAGAFGTPRFDALFNELHRDVVRYIEQGDGGADGGAARGLSPEGAWGRARVLSVAGMDSAPGTGGSADDAVGDAQRQAFIDEVLPLARGAGAKLGVAPEVLTAQAALETGWGRSPIRAADGSSSHNYFGIKATGWQGAVAQAMTTEVEGGAPVARSEAFRAYASPSQSFDDLARLVGTSPRYQGALNAGADARAYGVALQRGGYATDPAYAEKLTQVAARVTTQLDTAQKSTSTGAAARAAGVAK